jgi:hypothetical protein
MRIAIIETASNQVSNVIVGDSFFDVGQGAYLVALEDGERCEIGQHFDAGGDPRFTGIPDRGPQSWTSYEFLLRFTPDERAAFRAAALSDPAVADFQQLASAAQEIINTDPVTIAGMNYLVAQGLITEARKSEILGG